LWLGLGEMGINRMGSSQEIITVHEVTYASGAKRVSVLCNDVEEVRGMVDKFLGSSSPGGNSDHDQSLKITRKAMSRKEFDSLEDWDGGGGGGGGKAGRMEAGKGGRPTP